MQICIDGKSPLCAVLALTVSGCSGWKFYEIESDYVVVPSQQHGENDIIRTPHSQVVIAGTSTIAVSAPWSCLNEKHSTRSGIGTPMGALLQADCGQEMAYIEGALIEQGYRIISWRVINNIDGGSELSPLEVARTHGAQLLLDVNSIERTFEFGVVTEWHRTYYLSDKHGVRGVEIELSDHRRMHEAADKTQDYERNYWIDATYPSVNLRVSATDTESGEAVWFYNGVAEHADKFDSEGRYSTKWACDRTGDCKPWGTAAERKAMKRSPNDYSIHHNYSENPMTRKAHDALIKQAASEMAQQLKLQS